MNIEKYTQNAQSAVTVSYTHLDVYKRQAFAGDERGRQVIFEQ